MSISVNSRNKSVVLNIFFYIYLRSLIIKNPLFVVNFPARYKRF